MPSLNVWFRSRRRLPLMFLLATFILIFLVHSSLGSVVCDEDVDENDESDCFAESTTDDSDDSDVNPDVDFDSMRRILVTSLGLAGHAVPLLRLGSELVAKCCADADDPLCVIDFASNSAAHVWWKEEMVAVKTSICLGKFIDLGPLPKGWAKKLNRFSKDPSLFRSALSVFSDLYLEALPAFYSAMTTVLPGASLLLVDLGTLGALERARSMDIPIVIHSATIWADAFSQFEPPHWLPAFGSGFTKAMTLTERCLNALLPRLFSVALQPALMRVNKMRFEAKLDPYQSSHQVFQDVRTISSTALGFEYPRLTPPLHAFVGPILPRRGNLSNVVTPQMKGFLGKCFSGKRTKLILVRFGSMIPLERKRLLAIQTALEWISTKEKICVVWWPSPRQSQKGLVKSTSDAFTYPQTFNVDQYMTLLRMAIRLQEKPPSWPTTVVSISTCGMAAVQEPLYHGIPVLCVPLVADQADVAARLIDSGAGLVLHKEQVTADAVLLSLNSLLNDKQIKRNAEATGALFRLAGGRERAATHVLSAFFEDEYMLLNKSLAWHKRVALDVSAVFASMFITVAMSLFLYRRFARKQRYGF